MSSGWSHIPRTQGPAFPPSYEQEAQLARETREQAELDNQTPSLSVQTGDPAFYDTSSELGTLRIGDRVTEQSLATSAQSPGGTRSVSDRLSRRCNGPSSAPPGSDSASILSAARSVTQAPQHNVTTITVNDLYSFAESLDDLAKTVDRSIEEWSHVGGTTTVASVMKMVEDFRADAVENALQPLLKIVANKRSIKREVIPTLPAARRSDPDLQNREKDLIQIAALKLSCPDPCNIHYGRGAVSCGMKGVHEAVNAAVVRSIKQFAAECGFPDIEVGELLVDIWYDKTKRDLKTAITTGLDAKLRLLQRCLLTRTNPDEQDDQKADQLLKVETQPKKKPRFFSRSTKASTQSGASQEPKEEQVAASTMDFERDDGYDKVLHDLQHNTGSDGIVQ